MSFDSLDSAKLLSILIVRGFPMNHIQAIKLLTVYMKYHGRFCTINQHIEEISINEGWGKDAVSLSRYLIYRQRHSKIAVRIRHKDTAK